MEFETLEEAWERAKDYERRKIDPLKPATTNPCDDCATCIAVCDNRKS